MAMGRSGTLALTLAVAASLLHLLLLLPPPVRAGGSLPARPPPTRPPPKIPSNAPRERPPKKFTDFLKSQARQDKPDSPPSQHKNDDDQLGTGAADTASPVYFNLYVGTPPVRAITGVMDISSQLVWAQCGNCTACLPPPATTFWPDKWFSVLPCSTDRCQSMIKQPCDGSTAVDYCTYTAIYGDGAANTSGYLATDTFTFGTTPVTVPGMVFGCSGESAGDFYLYGASGIIGFGRGALSLVSQLRPSRFSYFLAPDDSDGHETVIQLGRYAVPQTKRIRSTPLLNSSMYPDLYYVKLTGIQVDGKDLNGIPAGTFDLRADGSGGVFLSTTTPITYLEQAAYDVVKKAFVSRIQLPEENGSALGPDVLCYTMQSMENVRVPRLTLVFDGGKDAAAMELKTANYFFKDSTTGLECLTILPSQGGSVLGSLLQTGKNMIYDIDGAKLTFETAGAAAPPPAQVSSLMIIAPCFLVLWVLLS